MFIYNTTIQVAHIIHKEWLLWMRDSYIDLAMKSGCFTKHQLVRLLEVDDEEGVTYALQLYADTKADYNRYIENYLPQNEIVSYEKWGGDVVSFSTLMQIVE